MSISSNFPTSRPSLSLNFLRATSLDPRITFTRSLDTATYFDDAGILRTALANTPRFDYDPSTLAPRGLLIEEQRTNLLTYSEQFDNAAWTKNGTTTIVANDATAPDGTTTADRLVVGNGLAIYRVQQNFAYTAGVTYSHTCYVKKSSYRYAFMYGGGAAITGDIVILDLDIGTLTLNTNNRGSVTALNNGWYRLAYTATAATTATEGLRIGFTNSPSTVDVTGDGASGGLLWGAQLEVGSFATSYIPTVASQVTRNADVASVNTLSPWFNATEGAFNANWSVIGIDTSTRRNLLTGSDAGNNRLALRALDVGINYPAAAIGVGTGVATLGGVSYLANVPVRVAFAYGSNSALSQNGGSPVTDPSAASVLVSKFDIGNLSGGAFLNGHIRRITYYPTRLSNSQLQALTQS